MRGTGLLGCPRQATDDADHTDGYSVAVLLCLGSAADNKSLVSFSPSGGRRAHRLYFASLQLDWTKRTLRWIHAGLKVSAEVIVGEREGIVLDVSASLEWRLSDGPG